jgi:NAD(P)-dependent dehydrogenase (short-subunit alcohol dehydrogenase family)
MDHGGRLLSGKTIMITGASSGIGAAAARLFAAEGAAVVLVARRERRLQELAEGIRAEGGRAEVAAGDVTARAGWGAVGPGLHETDDAVFDQIMEVNVHGVWQCLKHQIPVMLRQGSGGAIVNTSSTAGLFATGAVSPYVAAKHAVLGLTRAAAAEYGRHGIRVNALMVGATRTELMESAIRRFPGLEQAAVDRAILPSLAEPVEVARAAAWLLSDQASFVTGGAVPVDGGASAV